MQLTGNLFMVCAPSGAGKTSLVAALLERHPEIHLSISSTTRDKRPGEVDGQHYHFLSGEGFHAKLDDNAFLEHAEVFGNHYGTSRSEVVPYLEKDQDVLLEIDWQGARQVRTAMPRVRSIFILPPSISELERRLRHRAQDSDEVIQRRMSQAREEMVRHCEFDYVVINDDFERAIADLEAIVRSERLRLSVQSARHARLLDELLAR
jgi:guanylate kinase